MGMLQRALSPMSLSERRLLMAHSGSVHRVPFVAFRFPSPPPRCLLKDLLLSGRSREIWRCTIGYIATQPHRSLTVDDIPAG
jgi:hypothetical protein